MEFDEVAQFPESKDLEQRKTLACNSKNLFHRKIINSIVHGICKPHSMTRIIIMNTYKSKPFYTSRYLFWAETVEIEDLLLGTTANK